MENGRLYSVKSFVPAIRRVFGSYKYWLRFVLIVIIAASSPYILEMLDQAAEELPTSIIETFKQGNNYNIGLLVVPSIKFSDIGSSDRIVCGVLSGNVTQFLIVFLSCGAILGEFSGGYALYSLISGHSRIGLYLKYITLSVVIIIPVLIVLPITVYLSVYLETGLTIENIPLVISELAIQSVMLIAITIISGVIAILIGKSAILINMCTILGMPVIPNYVRVLTNGAINIDRFSIFSRLVVSCEMLPERFLNDIIIALFSIIIAVGIGSIAFSYKNFR